MRRDPSVRDAAAKRFTRVLIDEFQDTDPIQTEIIFLLTGKGAPARHLARPGVDSGPVFHGRRSKTSDLPVSRRRHRDLSIGAGSYRTTVPRQRAAGRIQLQIVRRHSPAYQRMFRDAALGPSNRLYCINSWKSYHWRAGGRRRCRTRTIAAASSRIVRIGGNP